MAEAFEVCHPTWLETATKIYSELEGRNIVKDNLLQFVQKYKEELTLTFCQNKLGRHWHRLNFVRNPL
ncbi:hypothetical protein PHSC3_001045 [Chlamydiales bacterium STE3]|nr:hypothetical protein PHSC3_001045 [Chlamydiales bacterium STE3]